MFTTEKEFYGSLIWIFLIIVVFCVAVGMIGNESPLLDYLRGIG